MPQENKEAAIKGYNSIYEYIYFDSVNKLSNHKLCGFKNSYDFYVTFKVDTNANVIDIKIIEVPGMPLPAYIKAYLEKMITSSGGQWLPQVKDSKKVLSDELRYQACLHKKDQSIAERFKDIEPVIEYHFGSADRIAKIKEINLSPKKRFIFLSY